MRRLGCRDFTKLIFGHTDQGGFRVLREVFASIGKKSAKTAFAAAVAMTKLLLEEEQRDYVVLLAENRPQARIAFDSMVAMLRADEELARRFEIVDHRHTLRYPATNRAPWRSLLTWQVWSASTPRWQWSTNSICWAARQRARSWSTRSHRQRRAS